MLNEKLTNNQKLELINSMEFVDSSSSCGECEYVLAEDNETNRNILYKIGLTDEGIERDGFIKEGAIDISMIAWENTNANWYSRKEKRFFKEQD